MPEANEPKKETVRIALPPRANRGESSDTARIDLPATPPLKPGPDAPKQAAAPVPPPPPKPVARPPMSRPPMPTPSSSAPVRPPTFTPSAGGPVRPPSVPPLPPNARSGASSAESAPEPGATTPAPMRPMPPRPRVLPPAPRVQPPTTPSSGVSAAPANYPGSAPQTGPRKETARISTLPETPRPAPAVKMGKTQPLFTVPSPLGTGAPVITRTAIDQTSVAPVVVTASGIDAIPVPLLWAAFIISAVTLIIQIWNYLGS